MASSSKKPPKLVAVSPSGVEYELSPEAYNNALARGYKPKSPAVASAGNALGTGPVPDSRSVNKSAK